MEIYTTGYSNRKLDAWLRMLKKHSIEMLVDVRTLGKTESAKRPEFSKQALAQYLPTQGIRYTMLPDLGGYRHFQDTGIIKSQSPNLALSKENGFSTSDSFLNYADYMYANPNFEKGIKDLLALAQQYKTAYFCCEGWERQCHRNLISDYLTAFDLAEVYHIASGITVRRHVRLPQGVVQNNKLIYPA